MSLDIDVAFYAANLDAIYYTADHLPLDEIGAAMVHSVHENFDAEGRPDAWEPRQDDNPWPILKHTGALYNSIFYSTHGDEVSVDAGESYGSYHDEGTSRLPRRPFLMIQDEDEVEILNLIAQAFD